jgi:branched-chain amino acid aminotransferase
VTNDLLEGISRNTVIMIAESMGLEVVERSIGLTELYIADEVFACGTSAYISSVIEVDARKIGDGKVGKLTADIRKKYAGVLHGNDKAYSKLLTVIK